MNQETPRRTVRIEDELWEAAKNAAKTNGDNLADVIRDGLRVYISETKGFAIWTSE